MNLTSFLPRDLSKDHHAKISQYYSSGTTKSSFSRNYQSLLAHRYNLLISPESRVLEIGCGDGELLSQIKAKSRVGIDLSSEQVARGRQLHPELDLREGVGESLQMEDGPFDVIIISDTLNEAADVEELLRRLHKVSHRGTRLIINIYNTLWYPFLAVARSAGLTSPRPASSWLSRQDVINLCALADWEIFKSFGQILLPVPLGFLSGFVNSSPQLGLMW